MGLAFARPRALADDEIRAIISRFASAAALVERAGFQGVEIHGAHGYLVSQFLSPLTNLRQDGWGGTPEKRRRFLLEIVRAVRRAVSPSFAVAVKLNSADFLRGGFTHDESVDVAVALEAEGIDLLEISGGTYESAAMMGDGSSKRASTRAREAYFLSHAERVRARVKTPLLVTGGFRTSAGMDDAIASGAVDVVGLARPLALEPDLPKRLLGGATDRARPMQLSTGSKKLDSLVEASFYQAQLDRLGAGLPPAPDMTRLGAALAYFAPRRAFARPPFGGGVDPEFSLLSRLRPVGRARAARS